MRSMLASRLGGDCRLLSAPTSFLLEARFFLCALFRVVQMWSKLTALTQPLPNARVRRHGRSGIAASTKPRGSHGMPCARQGWPRCLLISGSATKTSLWTKSVSLLDTAHRAPDARQHPAQTAP